MSRRNPRTAITTVWTGFASSCCACVRHAAESPPCLRISPSGRRVRHARVFVALLFAFLFIAFGVTARHGEGSWDYFSANYASWHLVHEGDPWLDGSTVPGLEGDPEESTWVMEAENGHTVVRRFPGVIAIALPAYWIAQADTMTVVPGAITAALACALGITMLFLAIRTRTSDRRAAWACGILAFGTPVWTVAADAVWPHTVTVLGIGGMAWGAARQRWWLVGLFGGVALWGTAPRGRHRRGRRPAPRLVAALSSDRRSDRLGEHALPGSRVRVDPLVERLVEPHLVVRQRDLGQQAVRLERDSSASSSSWSRPTEASSCGLRSSSS